MMMVVVVVVMMMMISGTVFCQFIESIDFDLLQKSDK